MARVYVGGLRLPVEEDKIVALLERARGVEKVRDVEVHKGGNPIEQDCFMFAVIEPEEAADACVKAYNKCRWRKLTLKVERTKRGPFTLDMLKTPAGFDAPRKRKRPEAEIRPTLSSKPLRLRRCEGKREMVQVLPNKSNHFGNLSDDESSDDDDDDDDSDKRKNGANTWTVDFSEIKQPERVAPASDKPPPPLAAERAAAVRARLEAFENGTQHLSSADSDDGETQRALDNENTQLLGVLSSLLQEQQQASQSGNTEEEEFAAAYGIRKERTDGNSASADHGGGIVQFMDDDDDDNEKGGAANEGGEKTSDKMSDSDQANDADEDVVDDEDNEEEENAEDDEEEDEEEEEEEEEEKEEDDDEMKDDIVGNANENGAPEEAPKTQLRGIFEEFLSNKEQASSFSLFGSTFAGNAGADAEDSAETKDQDAPDSLSNANSTFAAAEIVPSSHTFHVADIFAAVDRVAAKRWQKDPADLFQRREGYEEEWLETQGEISRIFKSKAKLAKRHGLGRA
ncbi:Hypothetical Protein FCC1311_028722 [Hondaea fermentalgiana]|uniref:RRM domain-containing protein n=1 Tax=Hondaea fermentalgiana TaxID=2315210 RepID=A0A2R5GEJ0_9STRA|nr:Hypothetical Protein FCC1311_028722 [Hondaea fermentalgiana]|eukprot:GBG26651.1 Hypothetical Protein FCC1311_028722 [Hondaea fermentalgiana]